MTDNTEAAAIPIVGIGASAGGLEALRQLFAELPADTGMAFVVIQHLDPERPSLLSSVLAGDVSMPVVQVTERMRAEPNRVYVIPPSADLDIEHGFLSLVPRPQTGKLHLPIDSFFHALAEDLPGRAIGVVLSGSASDGTEGLRAIKAAGGITFAQDPESSQFRSMPESALAAGVVDFRLPPEGISRELVRLSRHPYLVPPDVPEAPAEKSRQEDERSLANILATLKEHAQLDFREYKRPTLMRRIARRMALRRLGSLVEYAEAVRKDSGEAKALAEDILIHVTLFFRDPSAFEALERQVLPGLLEHKDDDATLRVWVPGCSTGEEAYSLAICLVEFLGAQNQHQFIKLFGSDLSARAIEKARAGLYAESDVEGVSPERLARFFERSGDHYRVGRRIRDLCVFVRHDLTRDPPFARLDLISCRNVLIYFDLELQRRILPLLHHCLNTPGYLLLGGSEGIREFAELFVPVNEDQRIFEKTGESPWIEYPRSLGPAAELRMPGFSPPRRGQPARDAQRQADHVLLARYAPSGVVVNERFEVIQFRGRTGDFLEPPPGQPQVNVVKMARDGLAAPLREALEAAKAQSITSRRHGATITRKGQTRSINLDVVPLGDVAGTVDRHFLVVFEELGLTPAAPTGIQQASPRPDDEAPQLHAELTATRDYLQAITGEHQDTVEELGAANEELVAANEELQSANEELQSTQEELQSTNEELSTLNDELHNRNQQLDVIADDLVNVLESVRIPVIMVDRDLRIRRFTPTARQISSLLPEDVGRSIDDVKLKVRVDDLADRIRETVESLTPKEYEVQGLDGRWFKLHIRPYRTADHRLDGAILSFLDVDVLKRALEEAERARDYAQRIVETVPMSLLVLDATLRVVSANPAYYDRFATRPDATERFPLFELAAGALDVPALRDALERSLATRSSFQHLEVQCAFPGGQRDLVVGGCPIQGTGGDPMLLVALEDITEHRQLEASEREARIEAEHANRAKDLFLATLSHELRTPLNTILMSAQVLQKSAAKDPVTQRASAAIGRAVGNQTRLINDLLDISRIVSGKLMLDLQEVDLATVVQSAVDVARSPAQVKGIGLDLAIRGAHHPVHGDPDRLQQVVANLLDNAVKFTPPGGSIAVSLEAFDHQARITVSDTGRGLRKEMIPHLFDRFVQAESSMTRAHGGLGLGLAIARHIVDVHGGEVHVESPGEGQGTTFTVTLPLAAQDAEPAPAARRTLSRSISGVRVLLIDDDDDARESCAAMLTLNGAEVRAVSSAAEGLAAAAAFKPQAILCDIAMPGEDGYAFIRKLRDDKHGREIPAAALTALAGEADRRRALEAGFQVHLAKPIDSDRLATAVAALATSTT